MHTTTSMPCTRGLGLAQPPRTHVMRRGMQQIVAAKPQGNTPPDVPKEAKSAGASDWVQSFLSRFGPISGRQENPFVLDFEKPLVELENRYVAPMQAITTAPWSRHSIKEVRRVADDVGMDVTGQVAELEERAKQLRKDTYSRLNPVQRLAVARHPNRPTFLDIALNITDKFVELHGDRAGLDDPAIVCGIGTIDDMPFMFIGHQKGRNTKENIYRNFGMPQPNGYRKALRFMRHADKFGFPILTFVDTPGAYAGKAAEELGQGEAIAVNLREMFGFRVPIISVVIGEGGSGGALAIGCANRTLIMENSVYYVASPEACAAILWKSRDKAAAATEALKITASDLTKEPTKIMDDVVPEPLGGAHTDPMAAFPLIKDAILKHYNDLKDMDELQLRLDRYAKFRQLGLYEEFLVFGGQREAAVAERDAAEGAYTAAGTWAASPEEAKLIEELADADEKWDALMQERSEWLNPPSQPAGLQDDMLRVAMEAIEDRRRQQAEAEASATALPNAPLAEGEAPAHKVLENGTRVVNKAN